MKIEFNNLALGDKVNLISKQGRYLDSTNFHGATVKLYNVKSFFVEVYYHPVLNKIMRISLATDHDLKKHLEKISLPL